MNQNELETTEPAFICKENTGEEMKEVLRIECSGDVIWRGRKIKSDTEFRAAMMELNDSMRKITSELSPLERLTENEVMEVLEAFTDEDGRIIKVRAFAYAIMNAMIEKNGGK